MRISTAIAAGTCTLAFAAPAGAVESPPTGVPPNVFATQFSDCLGKLRSTLAQGGAGVPALFANGFGPGVNPGVHQGTVGEYEFLHDVLGLSDAQIAALCSG